jgi:type IV conjugative transfer system protein TraL
MLFIFPMMFGLFFDQLTLGIVISVGNYRINQKYKERFGKGQIQAVAYWFLPSGYSFKKLPPSHIREYLG